MKGSAAFSAAKRRWRGPAAAVLALLVLFSLLVPLAFLLGLHNRLSAGYFGDDHASSEPRFRSHDQLGGARETSEGDQSRIANLMKRFGPTILKDVIESSSFQAGGNLHKRIDDEPTNGVKSTSKLKYATSRSQTMSRSEPTDTALHTEAVGVASHPGAVPTLYIATAKPLPATYTRDGAEDNKKNNLKGSNAGEVRKSCQLEFGSYCLWSKEHEEVLNDPKVQRLKDQLFMARAYYPSVAKLRGKGKLSLELKQNIQEHERMLSDVISDADLPPSVEKKIQEMDHTIARANSCTVVCTNVDKKLRQILDLTEDEARFHMRQSAFLYRLGAQTMPKSLHCLSMRLTLENFESPSTSLEHSHAPKLDNPKFKHHVIFSRNILAASVAINSTVMNSLATRDMVFHLVTGTQNYYAMKLWFARNSYKEATIHVLNFEELNLSDFHNPGHRKLCVSEEFRVSTHDVNQSSAKMRTEYISVFGHSHFLLPDIFKNLKKVVVLDDDVVVQRDLSSLWNLDLEGKVIGAVEFCGVRLGLLKAYLGGNNFSADSCAWMSGLNIVDLEKWREHNVMQKYLQLIQKVQSKKETLWRAATLPASLLAFHNLIHRLDNRWCLSGLGHDYGVSADAITNAASLHYNGNMKPWLELGVSNYKKYWRKFLAQKDRFMSECNVNL